jgi:type VII secretion-associated serine protease mycosin
MGLVVTDPPRRRRSTCRVTRGPISRRRPLSAVSRLTATALFAAASIAGTLLSPAPPAAASLHAHTGLPAAYNSSLLDPISGDSVRDEQWQLDRLHATEAWRYSTGEGVTVAVLDSGVDATHPDLVGQVLPGTDLVDGTTGGRSDPVGHGTTVAALIAGRGDDTRGVEGLAPKAKILPVRVLDKQNRYDDAMTVANGVRWAVDHGATVLNLSLGGTGSSEALGEALDYALDKDVVVVACTGNATPQAPTQVWYPAREPGVIAVAGLSRDDTGNPLWPSSLTGPQTVLAAPAADLLGARPGGYWRVQGTSFASPLVAASAALIRSRWPHMSAANVINRLIRTADNLGPPGRDDQFGYGMVDPAAALTATVPDVPLNPLDTEPPHGVAKFGEAPDVSSSPAQALQAPTKTGERRDGVQAAQAGGGANPTAMAAPETSHLWQGLLLGLAACVVLLLIAAVVIRRFMRDRVG